MVYKFRLYFAVLKILEEHSRNFKIRGDHFSQSTLYLEHTLSPFDLQWMVNACTQAVHGCISLSTHVNNLMNKWAIYKKGVPKNEKATSPHLTYPLVKMTVGAPRIIGQPLFFHPSLFSPFEELHPTLNLSIPLYCLPISFPVGISFSLLCHVTCRIIHVCICKSSICLVMVVF